MKSGEVAVEKSVDTLRELKSGKLKNRTAMVHVSPHSHYRHQSRPHEPQLAHYQPHLYAPLPMPYQPQPSAVLQSHPAVQHQRSVAMNPFGIKRAGTANHLQRLHQQPPPPPLPQQERGVKWNVKQSTAHQPPPVSLPVQLQASAGVHVPRGQAKRNVCARYTRGSCYYGSSCKFVHDDVTFTSVPQSAPAAIAACSRSQTSPAPPDDNQSNAPSSLRDVEFPSLSAKRGSDGQSADYCGNQCARDLHQSSPSKKLVFLDAVLQQNCKASQVKPRGQSPIKLRANSDEEPASLDDSKARSSNQSIDETDEHPQIPLVTVEGTQGYQPLRPPDRGRHTSMKHGSKDYSLQRMSLQPQHFAHQPRLQVVLPEPGQSGYAVQPMYENDQSAGTDDSAVFSMLSRDANNFVKRLDSRLHELYPFQERAIAMLQGVAASIWSDSTISVYGSNFTRLALPQSDIDCVLSLPSQTCEQPSELLRKLACELRRHPSARRVNLVDSAKIPVLKIVFCHSSKSRTEVMLDLTCAHSPGHSGLRARDLIYSYQVEMPALRPLVLILKSHIQRRGLNSAYTGGLSSYGLVILVIRFLQACGDEHHVREAAKYGRADRVSETAVHAIGCTQFRSNTNSNSPPVYEFTRDGKLTWRTGLGNLLLLFLETYVTFDYRRFGVTIEGNGLFFPLPSEMVPREPGAVVSPHIVDPISSLRSIGNSFRMHEIIQAWYEFYQQLTNGISVDDAISSPDRASRPV